MRMLLFKCIRDVLEENQTEDNVFVLGGIHVAAQLVRSRPQFFLEAERRAAACAPVGVVFRGSATFCRRHKDSMSKGVRNIFAVTQSIAQSMLSAEIKHARSGPA